MNKREIGQWAEQVACEFLKSQGYEVIEQNFYSKIGEVDIIAKDGIYLVFVEVKYRKNSAYGSPAMAVNQRKQEKIRKTSMIYLRQHNLCFDQPIRYDVVEILGKKIRVLKDAF